MARSAVARFSDGVGGAFASLPVSVDDAVTAIFPRCGPRDVGGLGATQRSLRRVALQTERGGSLKPFYGWKGTDAVNLPCSP